VALLPNPEFCPVTARAPRRHRAQPPVELQPPGERQAGGVPRQAVFAPDGSLLSVSSERQELLCSLIGLLIKMSLVGVVAVSLVRLATAYQERMDRQGELSAVLELEAGKLAKARDRFDQLFVVEGEQRLIREQNQWIAPNRLRVVWNPGS